MTIQLVLTESFQEVEAALHAALADCGFKVKPSPVADGVEIKSKMAFWLGERGNGVLSLFLPWVFKTESLAATVAAYQDGTTALTVKENSTHGGNLAGGASRVAGGALGGVAGAVAFAGTRAVDKQVAQADVDRKAAALSKVLQQVEGKLREQLGARIAYEGPVRPEVQPVML